MLGWLHEMYTHHKHLSLDELLIEELRNEAEARVLVAIDNKKHEERMAAIEYIGSEAHVREVNNELHRRAHEGGAPWEEDDPNASPYQERYDRVHYNDDDLVRNQE
jgi:hypothetical protein